MLPLISSLTREFCFFLSDNQLRERSKLAKNIYSRSTNRKIEKSRFLHLQNSYPLFYLISRYLENV